jgi:hypothetical protein
MGKEFQRQVNRAAEGLPRGAFEFQAGGFMLGIFRTDMRRLEYDVLNRINEGFVAETAKADGQQHQDQGKGENFCAESQAAHDDQEHRKMKSREE